jgi:threonine/homoserine/homoserine lactone efflux protein
MSVFLPLMSDTSLLSLTVIGCLMAVRPMDFMVCLYVMSFLIWLRDLISYICRLHNVRMIAELALVLKGMAAGFTISMPVGPVAVLCITRTLHKGRFSGFMTGSAGASADTFYALAAGFGLSIVINFIETNRTPLQIVASVFVLFFGVMIFTKNPVKDYRNRGKDQSGWVADYFSALPLAFTNPVSLFVYLGVFSGISLAYTESTVSAPLLLVPGVVAGSLLWWFTLSSVIHFFRNKIKLRTLLRINQIAGLVIIIFGLALILSLFIN